MIILGIDPGIADTGFGIIEKNGSDFKIIKFGVIKTLKTEKFPDRLLKLSQELEEIIREYDPDLAAIEQLFFYNNSKTALFVGEARGVITVTLARLGIKIVEFTPLQVKQALTGSGSADKLQVQKMLSLIFKNVPLPKSDDAADALAIAYCSATTIHS